MIAQLGLHLRCLDVKALALQTGRQLSVMNKVFLYLNEFTRVQFRCVVANLGMRFQGSILDMLLLPLNEFILNLDAWLRN